MQRKWLPTFAELIDRLSIHQLKEVFIPEHKDKFDEEMKDITSDIDAFIVDRSIPLTGELVRCIIAISQINEHIWYN